MGEGNNVRAALTQRRNEDGENVQAEIKVFAKMPGFYGSGKIDVGEGDETGGDMQSFGAAEPFEGAFLKDAEEFGLRRVGKRGNFIEDDGAVAAQFQAAELALFRAGEGAAFVAEEFAFDKFLREAGAIDFEKRGVTPRTKFVDHAREIILAGTAFASNY